LFLLDVGLIKYLARLTNESIMLSEAFQFKGQLTENYVLEQLLPMVDYPPSYCTFAQNREIDFVLQHKGTIVPIEVKSGENKNAVSFKSYIDKYQPEVSVRFSTKEYLVNGAITNIPLYFAGKVFDLLAAGK
jgi:predicted AAA+ superfamily ATPase